MDWERVIGLGVAGNFAGHLEQAGEADDFKDLVVADASAPKGIFPFYVPAGSRDSSGEVDHFLHVCPISSDRIRLGSEDERHQIEPEVSLLCDLVYEHERVIDLLPREAMAHNDCSIRREGARKISEKKNWGPESKGTAAQSISIDRFERGGVLDDYRIASYLFRANELVEYGVNSPVSSYRYMYGPLRAWLISRLNDQIDEGPLENISKWLAVGGRPAQALISIGATRYTEFGETTFLDRGDRVIVAVYDGHRFDAAAIERFACDEEPIPSEGISLLRQEVV
ncbi:MAG: hypothetical protein GY910_04490 [bacterium]|nr:hypothetical protein [Deltaproteobacteria bacterium]MCP4904218.1 hypothetical protein [bacterium]